MRIFLTVFVFLMGGTNIGSAQQVTIVENFATVQAPQMCSTYCGGLYATHRHYVNGCVVRCHQQRFGMVVQQPPVVVQQQPQVIVQQPPAVIVSPPPLYPAPVIIGAPIIVPSGPRYYHHHHHYNHNHNHNHRGRW